MTQGPDRRRAFWIPLPVLLVASSIGLAQTPARRVMEPEDLFRIRRVGATAWSPDGRHATIELTRAGRWLDSVPASDIMLLDVTSGGFRLLSPRSAAYTGFFNAAWSPDGRRLAFLSADPTAVVRLWLWNVGGAAPTVVPDIDVRIGLNDPPLAWIDGERLAVVAWDAGAQKSGPLYTRILRGRNAADAWRRAAEGSTPSVAVVESRPVSTPAVPSARLLAIDAITGARKTLARGRLHRLAVSPDGCCVSFLRPSPGVPGEPVASYFSLADRSKDVEAAYDAVNWGTERHVIHARSGEAVTPVPEAAAPRPKASFAAVPPRADARRLSVAPTGDAALYVADGGDGSRLWLVGGAGRPPAASREIWRGNEWMAHVRVGRAQPVAYTAGDGTAQTAWLLLPPNHVDGDRAPVIAVVYPGTVYGASVPTRFSAFQADFEHPQLLAALGYAVLLPSMPAPANSADSHSLDHLPVGVLPAVDAVIRSGVADGDRIAVMGQSDGGFAVLGLITHTNRFRSAVASASFSNLASLYGTFYGQYRHGDSGRPEAGQVLRMLQLEKGAIGLGGPPWTERDRYVKSSALWLAGKVETPLMLIHGELDFIPVQQAEEFFTALFRQDKRAVLVRYAGEGHTISDRPNVLDFWRRLEAWLSETMASRP